VANGFAIEIEDRGLGMTPARMAELNGRLNNPQEELNPANTEQLGLFVVGQLARRHGIIVTLRQSPYGGTTAVALIPQRLIVEEGPVAITAGDSGGVSFGTPPGAARNGSMGGPAAVPHQPVIMNGNPNGAGYGPRNGSYGPPGGYAGSPGSGAYGNGSSGNGSYGTGSYGTGSYGGGSYSGGSYGGGHGSPYPEPSAPSFTPAAPTGSGAFPAQRPDFGNPPADRGRYGQTAPGVAGPPPSPASTGDGAPSGGPRGSGANGGAPADGRRGRHGAPEVPVVTGVPVARGAVPPDSPFDVFTPLRRGDQDDAVPPAGPVNAPYAGSYPDYGSTSPAPPPYTEGNNGNNGGNGGDPPDGEAASGGTEDYKGLPRRVRQANLAPQLRSTATGSESTVIPPAATPSLSDMRNTLSAMQRGWQQGRSQSQRDTEGNVEGD
jgi:hypothetical protein